MRNLVAWCMVGILMTLGGLGLQGAQINEMRLKYTTGIDDGFLELKGAPGEDLDALSLLAVDNTGVLTGVESLAGASIPGDSFYYSLSYSGDTANTTYLLVTAFSGTSGTDLDTDDDGALDATPWASVVDSLAIVSDDDGGHVYSVIEVGPWTAYGGPVHVIRQDDFGPWIYWDCADSWSDPRFDTPGETNEGIRMVEVGETPFFMFFGERLALEFTANTALTGLGIRVGQVNEPGGALFLPGTSAMGPGGTLVEPDVTAENVFYIIMVTPNPGPDVTYSITIDSTGVGGIVDPDTVVLVKRDSGTGVPVEVEKGRLPADKGSGPVMPWVALSTTRLGPLYTASGLQGCSDFTFASSSGVNPLPVELDAFRVE